MRGKKRKSVNCQNLGYMAASIIRKYIGVRDFGR